ncbi:MAG TPA: zinc ribbon domain-containing protein [Candidatus Aminicenantes bacterium]|nr:zinc ribbon domain-containing protein [Candidatus Aminicenantes bacterium]
MPIYEYECKTCGERTEVLQKARDKPLDKCPKCGGAVVKRVSSPAIQFKGNGWYITDYAKKSSPAAGPAAEAKSGTSADAPSGSGDGAKKKPAKAEAEPAAKPGA